MVVCVIIYYVYIYNVTKSDLKSKLISDKKGKLFIRDDMREGEKYGHSYRVCGT